MQRTRNVITTRTKRNKDSQEACIYDKTFDVKNVRAFNMCDLLSDEKINVYSLYLYVISSLNVGFSSYIWLSMITLVLFRLVVSAKTEKD